MTEFERNYFGDRMPIVPKKRSSLARKNSYKESLLENGQKGEFSSLRRNLSLKKEVNFLSPTKHRSPSPFDINQIHHHYNHHTTSGKIPTGKSSSLHRHQRQLFRSASLQHNDDDDDRDEGRGFLLREQEIVNVENQFARRLDTNSFQQKCEETNAKYSSQFPSTINQNRDNGVVRQTDGKVSACGTDMYESNSHHKQPQKSMSKATSEYYSDSTTCSDSAHYNAVPISKIQDSGQTQSGHHFKQHHHSSSTLSLSHLDGPLKHGSSYRSDNQNHFGTLRLQNSKTLRIGSAASSSHLNSSTTSMPIHNALPFSRTGSLKRTKGRSNQSLCSCDADTEVNLSTTSKPLIQYGRDQGKDGKSQHTYSCEQNAQILLRIEKERQMKKLMESSTGKLNQFGRKDKNNKCPLSTVTDPAAAPKPPTEMLCEKDYPAALGYDDGLVDNIPPPPQPPQLRRNLTNSVHQQSHCALISNQLNDQHHYQKFGKHNLSSSPSISSTSTSTQPIHHHSSSQSPFFVSRTLIPNGGGGGGFEAVSDDLSDDVSGYNSSSLQNYDGRINTGLISAKTDNHMNGIPACANLPTAQPDVCNFAAQNNSRDNYEKLLCSNNNNNSSAINSNSLSKYQGIVDDSHCQQKWPTKEKILPNDASILLYHRESPEFMPSYDFSTNKIPNGNILDCRYFEPQFRKQNLFLFTQPQHHHQTEIPDHHHHFEHHLGSDLTASRFDLVESDLMAVGKQHHQRSVIGTPTSSTTGTMPWRHRQCSSSRGSSSSGNSSARWEMPSRHWLALTSILLIAGAAGVAVPLALRVTASAPLEERLEAASQLLDSVPLIDGHNDLPWNIRKFLHNQLNDFDFDTDLRNVMPWAKSTWSHTDLSRLRKGRVSAQFWAAYVPCEAQHRDAVQLTLEQIDVIKRLTERYSPELTSCASVNDILDAHKNHQLCSLTGVEGGHSLGGSLGVLRTLYTVGVRYLTLTSTCHTPWADSSHADAPKFDVKHGGLTSFGKTIIREMNRLGMIVDLSHTSIGTMKDALEVSDAPVIFSHSSAFHLCNSSRNVNNDILEAVNRNRGIVMVNFYSRFLSCSENATVQDAVAHINHIKNVAGIDHVGLGAGFDGINFTPKGLEDVSTYPMLFAELLGNGWTVEELTKLAGENFLRVMTEVEVVRDKKKKAGIRPFEDIPNFRSEDPYNCTSS